MCLCGQYGRHQEKSRALAPALARPRTPALALTIPRALARPPARALDHPTNSDRVSAYRQNEFNIVRNLFSLTISPTALVDPLNKLIKAWKPGIFDHISADELHLWKLRKPLE